MPQQQLAQVLGVTLEQFKKYERAINRMSAGRLYQLSLTLEVPVQYFFEGLSGRRKSPDRTVTPCSRGAGTSGKLRRFVQGIARSRCTKRLNGNCRPAAGPFSWRFARPALRNRVA